MTAAYRPTKGLGDDARRYRAAVPAVVPAVETDDADTGIDHLLVGLDEQQRAAVLSTAGPLCIIAGAGSGKTAVLTRRIARRVADGSAHTSHILALTFTRQAAGELYRRLDQLWTSGSGHALRDRPTVGTFHGVAYQVLQQRWADQGKQPPTLVTNRASIVRTLPGVERQSGVIADLVAAIDWARARRVTPDQYHAAAGAAGRPHGAATPDRIVEVYAQYELSKKKRRLIDFDDLLEGLLKEIEKDRAFAEVQRWRFRHLFVDEFQDINPLQMMLLEAWRSGRPDLCMVGDPNQAIYGWNGSDPRYITEVERLFPGVTVVRLSANYRSTPQIINAGQHVLGSAAAPVTLIRPDGSLPELHSFASDTAEADGIGDLLRANRRPGRRWSSCAVLTRTNAQLVVIEDRLTQAGIPTLSRSGSSPLDHPEVSAAFDLASGAKGTRSARDWIEDVQAYRYDPEHAESLDRNAIEALDHLIDAVHEHLTREPFATPAAIRSGLIADRPGADGVHLLTFHAAKGREWPVVVVAGLERGLVPFVTARTPNAVAEESRLLYVALTRATEILVATWARTRTGQRAGRVRSPLLHGLPFAEVPNYAPAPTELTRRRRRGPDVDPVLKALHSWRTERARISGFPAAFVLSDDACREITARRPATMKELANVPGLTTLAIERFGPSMLTVLNAVYAEP